MSSSVSLYDFFTKALTSLFLLGLPLLAAVAIAGTVASALQAATSMREPALGYAARILTASFALYLLFPAIARNLMQLCEMVFRT